MNLWQTIKGWVPGFAGATENAVVTKSQEAAIPAAGIGRDPGEGFRSLTVQSERDLTPIAQDRMIAIAYWLWETNGLARRVIEMMRDFVVGEGIGFEAKDAKVEAAIKKFWNDAVNLFDLKLPKKIAELGLYGEQCYPIFVSEFAGAVRMGYVDPANIKEVVTDPENCECLIGVALKNRGNKKGKRYAIVLAAEAEEMLSAAGQALRATFTDGECFYFTINNVSNASRGRSDLLTIADWCDGYEQFLYDRLDARSAVNSFVWDIKFTGLNADQIKEQLDKMPSHKRGMVFGHNENVERDAIAPDLKADDAASDAAVFKNHILGSKGLPPTWFAEGGDVNRATAAEMEPGVIKMLTGRQKIVIYMIEFMVRYQLRQKIAKRELAEKVTSADGVEMPTLEAFSIKAPDISVRDTVKLTSALQALSTSLMLAETQGWISKETAAKIFANIAAGLGMEVEIAETAGDQPSVDDGTAQVTRDYSQEGIGRVRRAYVA